MTELALVKFLRSGGTIEDLKNRYAIIHRRHGKYGNLVQFRYDQLESPMAEAIVQECRGIILDQENHWSVVARGFDKFFNFNEGHAPKIDWSNVYITEKVDGSLILLYYYDGAWHVGTSGIPDASGPVYHLPMSFAELFWNYFAKLGYSLPSSDFQDYTLIFELAASENEVICRYPEPSMPLIGLRHRHTGQQWFPHETPQGFPQYKTPTVFTAANLGQLQDRFENTSALRFEGYVVADKNFNRIKVKHPGYVAIGLVQGLNKDPATLRPEVIANNRKYILEVVRSGECSEFVAYYPNWTEVVALLDSRYQTLVKRLQNAYDEAKQCNNQKDFALKVNAVPAGNILFSVQKGKARSIRHALQNMNADTLLTILDKL